MTGVPSPKARTLAALVVPAAVVGVVSALTLIALSELSKYLEDFLWEWLPDRFGVGSGSAVWIITMLTVVGLGAGAIVWLVPGHAGPDPATLELVSPPMNPLVLPGLALVVILGLGGGVSLGPENPIVGINVALAVWLGGRATRGKVPVPQWLAFAAAGTIGAMFGTPVGAALVLTEMPATEGTTSTWDRLFAPLVAAAAGALTMDALDQPIFAIDVGTYPGARWEDVLSAVAVALAAAIAALTLVYAFPVVHGAFRRLRHPVLMLGVGGVLLGILGAIGGKITLFKGLSEMSQLVAETNSNGRLVVIIVVKLAALVIAASCGFRGGRIFPAVFVAVAVGILAHQLVDSVPLPLSVAAAILGIVLVVTRSGWLSLFMAVTVVGQLTVLPILCIALLPVWLLVTDRPQLVIEPAPADPPLTAAASPS